MATNLIGKLKDIKPEKEQDKPGRLIVLSPAKFEGGVKAFLEINRDSRQADLSFSEGAAR
jgi:hypothetical protein